MSRRTLADLIADARRQGSPSDLERFLLTECGDDIALRDELLHLLAQPATDTANYESGVRSGKTTAGCEVNVDPSLVAPLPEDVSIGEVLADKYRIRERIGEGGMGTVFAAEQLGPVERRVAVKVIKPGMDSKSIIIRFAQERQALALMEHPNIAQIHDGGSTRLGRPFFVMELVRGDPLTQFCDQEKLTVEQRVELFVPICRAVQHAHQKGIIHRDLKPSNILVALQDGKPTPKIIDFGVAKALH